MSGDRACAGERLPKHAFVASQGFPASALVPRCIESLKRGTSVPNAEEAVLISSFTSTQEREVLHRAPAKKRRVIHVCPQGIPPEDDLTAEQKLALQGKRLLFISPQPSGSRLNKKVATWCNEYVLRQAREVWVEDISLNGMLNTMIDALVQEKSGRV